MYTGPVYKGHSSPSKTTLIWLGAALAAALVLIFIFVAGKPEPKHLSNSPPDFIPFTSDGGYFTCVYPSGWHITSNSFDSKNNSNPFLPLPPSPVEIKMDTAAFARSGSAITITADNMPAAFGQLAQGQPGSAPGKPMFDLKGMSGLDRAAESAGVRNYSEGTEELFSGRLGQGSLVEFTGNLGSAGAGGSAAAVHGIVATLLGAQLHVQVICTSQEADWTKARPIFIRIINSLAPAS